MPLSRQLAELKRETEEPVCVIEAESNRPIGFVEFFDRPQSRHGFAQAQLLHYRLFLRDVPAGDGADAAPQVLTMAFSTADVIITGWRLERVTEILQDGKLVAVKTIPARHVGLTGNRPAIVAIEIRPLAGVQEAQQSGDAAAVECFFWRAQRRVTCTTRGCHDCALHSSVVLEQMSDLCKT